MINWREKGRLTIFILIYWLYSSRPKIKKIQKTNRNSLKMHLNAEDILKEQNYVLAYINEIVRLT